MLKVSKIEEDCYFLTYDILQALSFHRVTQQRINIIFKQRSYSLTKVYRYVHCTFIIRWFVTKRILLRSYSKQLAMKYFLNLPNIFQINAV